MRLQRQQVPQLLLRVGLAVVFIYAAVGSLMHPALWVGYLPSFIEKMSDAMNLLKLFAVFEVALALWILSGKFVKYAALVATVMFVGIVLAQPGNLIITFRDIGLAFMALALAFMQ